MSTITVQLPDSLKQGIEELSAREGFSVEQFMASAAGEKLAVMATMDYLRREAAAGRREDFEKFLAAVPDVPPMPGDELWVTLRGDFSWLQRFRLGPREASGSALNENVVDACLHAMKLFAAGDAQRVQTITFEVAMLGRAGLDINDPSPKYRLQSLAGEFTGLQLSALMYVGLKRIAPQMDAGVDLSKEYDEAEKLFANERWGLQQRIRRLLEGRDG